jgi:hypothetical protein
MNLENRNEPDAIGQDLEILADKKVAPGYAEDDLRYK